GLYPYLVLDRERRRRRSGMPKWLAMIAAAFHVLRFFPLRRLSIHAPGGAETCHSPCVFVGNNGYRIDGASLGTRERGAEGTLCLFVARQTSRAALLWLACRCILGRVDQKRDLRSLSLPAIDIEAHHRRLLVAFDGEVETMRSPLHYRIRPGMLRVFVPSPAPA